MKDFQFDVGRGLLRFAGDMSQFAGAKRFEFTEGKEKGVEAVDVRTGTGFEYTVLPGRGMDIAHCSFKGVPVSYMSKTGIVSPAYYDSTGLEWVRGFFGGLLTTCGLSNVGGPCSDTHDTLGEQHYGLHGRITHADAYQVCVQEDWTERETYEIKVSGKVKEAQLHSECFVLSREIKSVMGESRLILTDRIENQSCRELPLMLLYHINIGYPIVSEDSRLVLAHRDIEPNDAYSRKRMDDFAVFGAPVPLEKENVYFHNMCTDEYGYTEIGVVSDTLEGGVYIRYKKAELPEFSQWKMCGVSEYVMGLEPGNCRPVGRTAWKESEKMRMLEPYGSTTVHLEIGVLKDAGAIAALESRVKKLV
jgi:hypothetical protein